MIFASIEYILLFLPLTFAGYFALNKLQLRRLGKIWLVAASLVFYSYWSIDYLPLLLGSILFNFAAGIAISRERRPAWRKALLVVGIGADLALLGYYKYTGFLLDNLDALTGTRLDVGNIALPLGISFFTFTQIAYLVDSYKDKSDEYDLVNYGLFVTFFPHLIAGPILHHREMMTQFASRWRLFIRPRYVASGLFIFAIGLAKKVLIADTFAIWANAGFASEQSLTFFEAWVTSLSYTFQLYFDFSGYSDMAIGSALLFNIWLPINFNSPYKSFDIQEFWRRWHMTLSRFLRDYVYIPLGGNRVPELQVQFNLFLTFLIGGLWHGASWMFVIWGAMHGAALVVHRVWRRLGFQMPRPLAWLVTFNFVNIGWVFFRAESLDDAWRVLRGMVDIESIDGGFIPTASLAWAGWLADWYLPLLPTGIAASLLPLLAILVAFGLVTRRNSTDLLLAGLTPLKMIWAAALFCVCLVVINSTASTVFLYYNF